MIEDTVVWYNRCVNKKRIWWFSLIYVPWCLGFCGLLSFVVLCMIDASFMRKFYTSLCGFDSSMVRKTFL